MLNSSKAHIAIALVLILGILVPYSQVINHDFLNFDDRKYIVENPYINQGVTVRGFVWAFGFRHSDTHYWRPLTWFSHMLDFEVFGGAPGLSHLVNVGLHAANALLLYSLIFLMAGVPWMFSCMPGDDVQAAVLARALEEGGHEAFTG